MHAKFQLSRFNNIKEKYPKVANPLKCDVIAWESVIYESKLLCESINKRGTYVSLKLLQGGSKINCVKIPC